MCLVARAQVLAACNPYRRRPADKAGAGGSPGLVFGGGGGSGGAGGDDTLVVGGGGNNGGGGGAAAGAGATEEELEMARASSTIHTTVGAFDSYS